MQVFKINKDCELPSKDGPWVQLKEGDTLVVLSNGDATANCHEKGEVELDLNTTTLDFIKIHGYTYRI